MTLPRSKEEKGSSHLVDSEKTVSGDSKYKSGTQVESYRTQTSIDDIRRAVEQHNKIE